MAGLCNLCEMDIYVIVDGLRWIPDAVQLYCIGEDGTLAFHTGVDSYRIYLHNGNREDERGNTILKDLETEMLSVVRFLVFTKDKFVISKFPQTLFFSKIV